MTVTAETASHYGFWLQWVWSDLRYILATVAALEVVVLWFLRRETTQRLTALVAGGGTIAGGWWLTATGFYWAVKIAPNTISVTWGEWIGVGILAGSCLIASCSTAMAHLLATRQGPRSNNRLDPPVGPVTAVANSATAAPGPPAGQPER